MVTIEILILLLLFILIFDAVFHLINVIANSVGFGIQENYIPAQVSYFKKSIWFVIYILISFNQVYLNPLLSRNWNRR